MDRERYFRQQAKIRVTAHSGALAMRDSKLSRRDVFKASTALAVGAFFAEPIRAAAPTPSADQAFSV
jgi:hypothetical protein